MWFVDADGESVDPSDGRARYMVAVVETTGTKFTGAIMCFVWASMSTRPICSLFLYYLVHL